MQQTNSTTSKFRLFLSLAFWLTVLVSCLLFGLVYLAPKVVTHEKLSEDYYRNQLRLIEKQNRVEHFRNVANALQTDPQFRKEMQRVELGIVDSKTESQTESIPVAPALSLDPTQTVEHPTTERVSPWYVQHLLPFAVNPLYRQWSLLTAGFLMFVALVFLQESAGQKTSGKRIFSRFVTGKLFSRYRRV